MSCLHVVWLCDCRLTAVACSNVCCTSVHFTEIIIIIYVKSFVVVQTRIRLTANIQSERFFVRLLDWIISLK